MKRLVWSGLDAAQRAAAIARPAHPHSPQVRELASRLIAQVRADGDATLRALTRRFDGCELDTLEVAAERFGRAEASIDPELKQAIRDAATRIERFHRACMVGDVAVDTAPGVRCERLSRPIARVGLYIPAGSAPLPSTALMLGIPARLAGCTEVVACTPPRRDGSIDPVVLYAARVAGIDRVFRLGGAQAIAAMAYGTDSVPRCDKLFGPGNAYVTAAKLQVAADPEGAAIDMPAGPSEVLVVADAGADPDFVAADLLSQAEHGADSQALLLSDAPALLDAVAGRIQAQLASLPRARTARAALDGSSLIQTPDIATALAISNDYAPEHLVLALRDARAWLPRVRAAGSVFLGDYAAEALGDYCSGTNHVLPTGGAARACSGVSVASFQTFMTVQSVSATGLAAIGPCAVTLAQAEGLEAHARAVQCRLDRAGAPA
ncbi:MAG TPA: histidinol dehydrogenase [Xanthomonadaceae bacterium]|nr:histidinol dehydrogenase [Xanthomonadaceae bacterium]